MSPVDSSHRIRWFFSVASRRSSLLGGLKIALVVGVAVNLINQGEQILGLQFADISIPKLLVTFCIPFCVSIYNGTMTRLRFDPGVRAVESATLTCETCGHSHDIRKGDLVPDCSSCQEHGLRTEWSPVLSCNNKQQSGITNHQ